ncbi:MAG TPA: transglycosylase domain-containing protein [Acidimicrobiales bacterium]|nr:transglycosylase domain-containing protein [Acidimicrobiales bacterium]
MWRYRRLLFLCTLLLFTGLSGAAYLLVNMPLPPENPQAQTTVLKDASGARLASLDAGENRVLVGLDQVPKVLVDAVLAAEDRQFFEHAGIDPAAIVRAGWADIRGKALQGGSTITQQYVKNVYLGRERTIARKIKEAVYAIKVEQRHEKNEILERYLNTIYFGRGAYGVQAASRAYFRKDVNEVGLREAAFLAGLIRSPEAADVGRTSAEARTRRALTLAAMQRSGAISAEERRAVEAEPLESYVLGRAQAETTFAQPEKGTQYFVEYVRQQLERDYPPAALYRGGLQVTTTLDLQMQSLAYDAVYGFLNRPDDPAGALVAVDQNGHVRAMVGGRDWDTSKVNLAVGKEGGGTGRQPGSTFKPFVLGETVRQGYTVQSALPGPSEIVFPGADQGRDYKVQNFEGADFGSAVSLIDATANSVNTVYAQLIKAVGPEKVARFAHDAGIFERTNLVPNISLTLGTSEVSVLEMASAFTTFANRGEHVEPSVILEVRTADGRVLRPARAPARTRVLERRQADVVNHCLRQVVERGSGTGAQIGKPLAGKTGTTQDFGDAWFVGYTPKLTAAVWMGYPTGNTQKMTNVRGRKVNGGSFPATIFKRFMQPATRLPGMDGGSFPAVSSFPGKLLKGSVAAGSTSSSTTTSPPTSEPEEPAPTTTTTARVTTTTTTSQPRRPGVILTPVPTTATTTTTTTFPRPPTPTYTFPNPP